MLNTLVKLKLSADQHTAHRQLKEIDTWAVNNNIKHTMGKSVLWAPLPNSIYLSHEDALAFILKFGKIVL